MTKIVKDHLDYVRKESDILLKRKYIKGAIEHGGNLKSMGVMQLLNEALDENTDQRTYLIEARRKLINLSRSRQLKGIL